MRRLALLLCLVLPSIVSAQTPRTTTDQPVQLSVPTAAPADVDSIDGIIAAVYDVISGDPGEARDWARFRSLFVPTARLIPTGPRVDGQFGLATPDPQRQIAGGCDGGQGIERQRRFGGSLGRVEFAGGGQRKRLTQVSRRH